MVKPTGEPRFHGRGPDGTCQIGTSGWNYKHWANGRFYPPRMPAGKWLAYYARYYPTVEVNNSYYNIPSAETMARWARETPSTFTFALKLWRGITHYRKLHNCREFIERYFAFAGVLTPARRAPLLVQLPPHLGKDLGRLDAFFDDLRSVLHGARWQVAVEFRNASWLTAEVYEFLDRRHACAVLSDHGRCVVDRTNDAPFVYIRRHGQNYSGSYTPEEIAADARRIRAWLRAGKSVYVYYNNDVGGHALDNARQLMEALGIELAVKEPASRQGEFLF